MGNNTSSMVCSNQESCIEIVNGYNLYSNYIYAGLSLAVVVAIGILVIYLIKRKSKIK